MYIIEFICIIYKALRERVASTSDGTTASRSLSTTRILQGIPKPPRTLPMEIETIVFAETLER
jgi:hypothetical protein